MAGEEIRIDKAIRVKFRLSKKIIYWVGIPSLALILLVIGLVQQGIVGSWIDAINHASATVTVVDIGNQQIQGANVTIGDVSVDTNEEGLANLANLTSGKKQLTVKKAGYFTLTKDVKLKRGSNNLEPITLSAMPAQKATFSVEIDDFITENPISDAVVSLDGTRGIVQNNVYLFSQIPVGTYQLKATKSGYVSVDKQVIVEAETKSLETVYMVREGRVVFESNRDQGYRGIYYSNLDGSNQRPLISRKDGFEDYNIKISPDQTKVLFQSTRDGVKKGSEYASYLYIVGVDGNNLNRVSAGDNAVGDYAWSSTGKYVAYNTSSVSENGIVSNISYLYQVSSKTNRRVEGFKMLNIDTVVFSLDDQYFVLTGMKEDGTTGLYMINTSDMSSHTITDHLAYNINLTKTGFRYTSYDNNNNGERYFEYTISTLTNTEITKPAQIRNSSVISPDGTKKAYMANRDGKRNLFVSTIDDKNEIQLTVIGSVVERNITWSTDGAYILFVSNNQSENAIYVVSSSGRAKAKKVVDTNNSGYYQ